MKIAILIIFVLVIIAILTLLIINQIINFKISKLKRYRLEEGLNSSDILNSTLNKLKLENIKVNVSGLGIKYKCKENLIQISKTSYEACNTYIVSKIMQICAITHLYNTDENAKNKYGRNGFIFIFSISILFSSTLFALISMFIDSITHIGLLILITGIILYILLTITSFQKRSTIIHSKNLAIKLITELNIFSNDELKEIETSFNISKTQELIKFFLIF